MNQTFSDGTGKIYSVDLMFVYIHDKKPKPIDMTINDELLKSQCWTEEKTGKMYGPSDVIKNPKKYKEDMDRIKNANLKFPIIVYNGMIVDGMHRATKTILSKKNKLKAYNFDKDLMKKFLVTNDDKSEKYNNMYIWNYIELYKKRFGDLDKK